MGIHLPRIEGTGYDLALNEFIDSLNRESDAQQPKLAAHAVAAIGRFLVENHLVEAGTRWIRQAMPLVNHINIYDHMVNKIYDELVKRIVPDALAHQWASGHGFKVFLDRSTIPSGTLWRQSLLRAISECGFFVGVIDGDATPTEWVLAESAYATLLRKSIGKPRILLIVRNVKRIAQDQQNPFHVIYLDVFRDPPAHCYGVGILSADHGKLTAERFLHTLEEVQPMCLFFGGGKPSQPAPHAPTPSRQAVSISSSDNLQLTDRSWRTSVLLAMLLEAEGRSRDGLNFLLNKSFEWIHSSSSEKKTVGLNTLRLLFKGHNLPYSKDLLDKVSDVFFTDVSLAVKLAALDFLGAMSTTPNSLIHVSDAEVTRITAFRSELMKQMNVSQHAYAAKGVHADIARESSGRTHEEALRNVISRVDSINATQAKDTYY